MRKFKLPCGCVIRRWEESKVKYEERHYCEKHKPS